MLLTIKSSEMRAIYKEMFKELNLVHVLFCFFVGIGLFGFVFLEGWVGMAINIILRSDKVKKHILFT